MRVVYCVCVCLCLRKKCIRFLSLDLEGVVGISFGARSMVLGALIWKKKKKKLVGQMEICIKFTNNVGGFFENLGGSSVLALTVGLSQYCGLL